MDGAHDLLVREGEIAEIAPPGAMRRPGGGEVVDAEGLTCFPASSTRTCTCARPAARTRRTSSPGTRAAAAGGFCCVLAMPNTDPVVDNAPVLRSLHERAAREARVPVGFLAAITRGQAGTELTEMAELAREGAAGFSDDGMPVADARLMRQALQYQRLAAACSPCTRRTRRCRARA